MTDATIYGTPGGPKTAAECTASDLLWILERLEGKPAAALVRAELLHRLNVAKNEPPGRRYQRVDVAELLEVVHVAALRGAGTEGDPVRLVHQYWSKAGELLAERDCGAPDAGGLP